MYIDHSPNPEITNKVLVIEDNDLGHISPDKAVEMARDGGATTGKGAREIFYVVYSREPRRIWDFTERALRADEMFIPAT